MTTSLIIDASVFLKFFLPEEQSEYAHKLLVNMQQDETIHWMAPELVYAEVANALFKKVKNDALSFEDAEEILTTIIADCLVAPVPYADLLEDALNVAYQIEHDAIYDCLYLVLAIDANGQFVTADKRFYKKVTKTKYKESVMYIEDV